MNPNDDLLANKKVLVVDDEKDITDLLEEVLRKDGFTHVLKTHTGLILISLWPWKT